MPQGVMYYAAYGLMMQNDEDWFDLEKTKAYALKKMNLNLMLDDDRNPTEALHLAIEAHHIDRGIKHLVELADQSDNLECVHGSDGALYLLYFARFPWESNGDAQLTEETIRQNIVKTMLHFTPPSISATDILDQICYFSEELS